MNTEWTLAKTTNKIKVLLLTQGLILHLGQSVRAKLPSSWWMTQQMNSSVSLGPLFPPQNAMRKKGER